MSEPKMHLSPSLSPIEIQAPYTSQYNTLPRNELDKLLQREYDEAHALLDSNPFISSLLMKYTQGVPVAPAIGHGNDELITLRLSYNALQKDYERLQELYRMSIDYATQVRLQYEIQRDSTIRDNDVVSNQCNEILVESFKVAAGELERVRKELEDTKISNEKAIAKLNEEHQQYKRKVESELQVARAQSIKSRISRDFFWDSLSEKDGPPKANTLVEQSSSSDHLLKHQEELDEAFQAQPCTWSQSSVKVAWAAQDAKKRRTPVPTPPWTRQSKGETTFAPVPWKELPKFQPDTLSSWGLSTGANNWRAVGPSLSWTPDGPDSTKPDSKGGSGGLKIETAEDDLDRWGGWGTATATSAWVPTKVKPTKTGVRAPAEVRANPRVVVESEAEGTKVDEAKKPNEARLGKARVVSGWH